MDKTTGIYFLSSSSVFCSKEKAIQVWNNAKDEQPMPEFRFMGELNLVGMPACKAQHLMVFFSRSNKCQDVQ